MRTPFSDYILAETKQQTAYLPSYQFENALLDPGQVTEENEHAPTPFGEAVATDTETPHIDTEKAVRFNRKYEKELWGPKLAQIRNFFASKGFLGSPADTDATSFALAVARWQATIFKNKTSIDGALGPVSWSILAAQLMPAQAPVPARTISRWHTLFPDAVACPAEPLVQGKTAFRHMVEAIRTAENANHYIYILGWMLDIDFELVDGDRSTTLYNLLREASAKGVEIRVMSWNNHFYNQELNIAMAYLNKLPNTTMIRDNATFGSPVLKALILKFRNEVNTINQLVPFLPYVSDTWKNLSTDLNILKNEGSHHEKILVVNGRNGLTAFCGGIDINPDRREGARNRQLPESEKANEFKWLDSGCFGSDVLHDVHCKVKGHAANQLLQRFQQRWKVYFKANGILPPPLRGAVIPAPSSFPGTGSAMPFVKIAHTYNDPTEPSRKERTIREAVRTAINNANQSIHIEDQYMISLEIASLINGRLHVHRNKPDFTVTLVSQDDTFAGSDIKFPQAMRKKLQDELFRGFSGTELQEAKRKVAFKILEPCLPHAPRHKVHSKLYIIDKELAIIGSANCSSRSMTHDTETAAILFADPGTTDLVPQLAKGVVEPHMRDYVPNKNYRDKDVEILEEITKSLDDPRTLAGKLAGLTASLGSLAFGMPATLDLAVAVRNAIPVLAKVLRDRIKPVVIDIIDPDADQTPLQQELALEETEGQPFSDSYSGEAPDLTYSEHSGTMGDDQFSFAEEPTGTTGNFETEDLAQPGWQEHFGGEQIANLLSVQGYEDLGNSGLPLLKIEDSKRKELLSKSFTIGEFAQAAQGRYKWPYFRVDLDLINELQVLRDVLQKPVIIIDGYYPPKYLKDVLKVSTSPAGNPHISGRGVKIKVAGMTGRQLAEWIIQYCDEGLSISVGEDSVAIYIKQNMSRITSYIKDPKQKATTIQALEELDRKVKGSVIQVKAIAPEQIPDPLISLLAPKNDIRITQEFIARSNQNLSELLDIVNKFLAGKSDTDQGVTMVKSLKNITKLSDDLAKMEGGKKLADLLKTDNSGLSFLGKLQLLRGSLGVMESILKLTTLSEKKKKYEEFLQNNAAAKVYLSVDIIDGVVKLTSDTAKMGLSIALLLTKDSAQRKSLFALTEKLEKVTKGAVVIIEGLKIVRSLSNIIIALIEGKDPHLKDNLIDIGKSLTVMITTLEFGSGVVAGATFIFLYYKFLLVTLPTMVGDAVRSIASGSTIVALRELNEAFYLLHKQYLYAKLDYEKVTNMIGYDDNVLSTHPSLLNDLYEDYTALHRRLAEFHKYVSELYTSTRSTMGYYSSFPQIPKRVFTDAGVKKLEMIKPFLEAYPKKRAEFTLLYADALHDYYAFFYEGIVKCHLEIQEIYEERVQVGWGNQKEVEESASENELHQNISNYTGENTGYEAEAALQASDFRSAETSLADDASYRESNEASLVERIPGNAKDFAHNLQNSSYEMAETNVFRDQEIAELMEQQVALATPAKTCEGRTCWAKDVLNRLMGLSLSPDNRFDEAMQKALADFQAKNNLRITQKIDPPTERALLEADALYRAKGTTFETSAISVISSAKTKIEDWTGQAVNTKPQYILDSYRDPRKLYAFVLHQMAFKRKSRKTGRYSDPESYLSTGAHFCILFDGRIVQLYPLSRMIWHGNCTSPRSVGVEFEGNFPDIRGRWWVDKTSTVQNKDYPTQEQYEAGKLLACYLKTVLGTTHILAHRQSSKDRENDPGPDIWYNVGQWAVEKLGLSDGGRSFKCGTGNPILTEWQTWDNRKPNPSTELLAEFSTTDFSEPEDGSFQQPEINEEMST